VPPTPRLAALLALVALALGAEELEVPPIELSAAARLPPELLAGEHFRVLEPVENDGFMNHWRMASDWGPFEAASDELLRVRLHEIEALAQLEQVTSTDAFKEAFEKALTGKYEAARDVVQHPVETIKRIPHGVARMLRRTTRRARNLTERSEAKYDELEEKLDERREAKAEREAAEAAGDGSAGADAATDAERRQKTLHEAGEVAKDVGDEARRQFLRLVGYRRARLGWARSLAVDPYGDNEPLNEQLLRVSIASTAGGLPIRFAPLPTIPGLAELGRIKSMVYDLDELDLRLRNEAIFFDLGFTRAQVDRLYDERIWNATLITDLADAFQALESVPNLEALMAWALSAADLDEARFQAAVDGRYARIHAERAPIVRFAPSDALVTARLADGTTVAAFAVDHLAWSEAAVELFDVALRSDSDEQSKAVELELRGDATAAARRALAARGIHLVEHAF